jgi:hypothetical protein
VSGLRKRKTTHTSIFFVVARNIERTGKPGYHPAVPDSSPRPARQRKLVTLAVRVLQAATTRADGGYVDGADVRLALRCLLPHAPAKLLTDFWHCAHQLRAATRERECAEALEAICAALEAGGWYPGVEADRRVQIAEAVRTSRDDDDRRRDAKRRYYHRPPGRGR